MASDTQRRRRGVDGKRVGCQADVAGRIGGLHLERIAAVGEITIALRDAARCEGVCPPPEGVSEHASVAPSSALTVKAGCALFVGFAGWPVMLTAGGAVSTVNVYSTTLTLPSASAARTLTLCAPSVRPV